MCNIPLTIPAMASGTYRNSCCLYRMVHSLVVAPELGSVRYT